MQLFEESIFEPIARSWRYSRGIELINNKENIILVDIGCGPEIRFYHYAKKQGITFKKYIGIDPLISKQIINRYENNDDVLLIKNSLNKKLPLSSSYADYMVGFAFLEHVDYPKFIINDCIRVIKNNARIIFTTPSPRSKLLLELLAKVNLISRREIEEHKQYFYKKQLIDLIDKGRYKNINFFHSYFHPWLNNLFVVEKSKQPKRIEK